jgi:hypothetical protein
MADLFHIFDASMDDDALLREVDKYVEGVNVILETLFKYDRTEKRSESVTQHYWTDPDHAEMTIALVTDAHAHSRYLYVQGPDEKLVFRFWNNLRVALPVVELDQLKRDASRPGLEPGSLERLALGLNEKLDPESREIICNALTSDRRDVRLSAAAAALVLKWRSFVPSLEAAEGKAADEDERAIMRRVVSVLTARGLSDVREPPA